MKGRELDLYLSEGYFRMQQDVFTCRFILFEDRLCPVHWLRLDLARVTYGKSQRQLLKSNARFSVDVRPFVLTRELETLYAEYRDSITFDAPLSVEACLLDGSAYNVFDSYVVEVRDGARLIAAGIFDDGIRSIAGIMNFYHPDYRRYSLGKFLMLQKIRYAQQQQKVYYYPGYVVSHYPKFDYKLYACESATELFDQLSGNWLPFSWETMSTLAAAMLDE